MFTCLLLWSAAPRRRFSSAISHRRSLLQSPKQHSPQSISRLTGPINREHCGSIWSTRRHTVHPRKSRRICRSEKSPSNSFRIRSYKTKDLKSFKIRSYEKTYTYPPLLQRQLLAVGSAPGSVQSDLLFSVLCRRDSSLLPFHSAFAIRRRLFPAHCPPNTLRCSLLASLRI